MAEGIRGAEVMLAGRSMNEIRSVLRELRFDDGVEEDMDPRDRRTC